MMIIFIDDGLHASKSVVPWICFNLVYQVQATLVLFYSLPFLTKLFPLFMALIDRNE